MQLSDRTIIFGGLSIKQQYVEQQFPRAFFFPPACQGDLVRAFNQYKPSQIALIDGFFEFTPSVWHKDILYLISQGVTVYGSSSMGALRASELHDFGMIGHGLIFEKYKSGEFEDDDEVAVFYGPKEIDYPSLSEAMVNIRATVDRILRKKLIDTQLGEQIIITAKSMFYKSRTYSNILESINDDTHSRKNLCAIIEEHRIDQKKDDAISLLEMLKSNHRLYTPPKFKFYETVFWNKAF
ncbi:MAG: tfuA protein [Micavibrio aeruginosavorus]|uniref:TfuA protein n=1 Tax=Micavibrio aeruginosavorus TaxID=349221 RepID=A0A2W5FLJ7_9BACT|nr:MAG: tfuA protein [Micavibrio aeruginosavorus]